MKHNQTHSTVDALTQYSLLGRSGLRVSPLCLGTMTFGTEWGWGTTEETARSIFRRYLEAGGNFIDTADGYTNGRSEEMVGKFIQEMSNRDKVVLATKYTFNATEGDANSGGNSRKNMMQALDRSLKRLQTDYIDLYWMHCWDRLTPIEEVISSFNTIVQSGKVRYIGLSDVPAWYFSRMQTIAELRGYERISSLQLEYSLVERNIEREHVPVARELKAGICVWSPLAGGFLAGKYRKTNNEIEGLGRLQSMKDADNLFNKFKERNWSILDHLLAVSEEINIKPALVATNWITKRPGITSTIIGATRMEQLEENLRALSFEIPHVLTERLEAATRPDLVFPYSFFEPKNLGMMHGGITVQSQPNWY